MSKRIRGGTGPAKPKKRVTTAPAVVAPSAGYLIWRFGRLDHGGEFGCQTLLHADVKGLESELEAFQRDPIYSLQRKGWLKFVRAEDMTHAGRQRLANISKQENGLWQLLRATASLGPSATA